MAERPGLVNHVNKKLISAGLLLVIVALAMPGTAYHINSGTVIGSNGTDPGHWRALVGVTDPTGPVCAEIAALLGTLDSQTQAVQDEIIAQIYALELLDNPSPDLFTIDDADFLAELIDSGLFALVYDLLCFNDTLTGVPSGTPIFGFTACENNGSPATPTDPEVPSRSGQGGLCYMSAGSEEDASGTCHQPDTRSNGNAPNYNSPGSGCLTPAAAATTVIASPARNWAMFSMCTDATNCATTTVNFSSQVDGTDCTAAASNRALVDLQYLDTVSDGHMAGFPVTQPTPVGSYNVDVSGTTMPAHPQVGESWDLCDGPAPWYQ